MLVKFLSYTASVIGTARHRHRAVILSSLIVVLSLTGITSVVLFKDDVPARSTASNVEKPVEDEDTANTTPELGSTGSKQSAKDQGAQTPQNNEQSQSSASGSTNDKSSTENSKPLSLNITADAVAVAPEASSDAITIAVANESKVVWSITPESKDGVQSVVNHTSATSINFHFRASQDAVSKSTIQFIVTATDTSTGKSTSKTVTVTVL